VAEQQAGERPRNWPGRVAKLDRDLAVVVEDVVEGQAQDARQRLGVEQHQDGGDAGE